MVKLSPRLQKIADIVMDVMRKTGAQGVCDVGTDHAYIPIYCVAKGVAKRAVACDIADGPLATARENVNAAHFNGYIDVRKSDGLKNVRAGEAGVTVISGVGGDTIAEILADGKRKSEMFVLQPQTKVDKLRKQLDEMGFRILSEHFVEENDKEYTILVVRYCAG